MTERPESAEKKETENCEGLKVKVLSHAEAKALQDAAREKYKKAFEILKDR